SRLFRPWPRDCPSDRSLSGMAGGLSPGHGRFGQGGVVRFRHGRGTVPPGSAALRARALRGRRATRPPACPVCEDGAMTVFSEVPSSAPLEIWQGVLGRSVEGENGSLTFRIGEEERELRPGGMWAIPADVPHEVRVGPDGAVVVEAFAPRRDDWAALARREGAVARWPQEVVTEK